MLFIYYSTSILHIGIEVLKLEYFNGTNVIRIYNDYFLSRIYTREEKIMFIMDELAALNRYNTSIQIEFQRHDVDSLCNKETLLEIKRDLFTIYYAYVEHAKAATELAATELAAKAARESGYKALALLLAPIALSLL